MGDAAGLGRQDAGSAALRGVEQRAGRLALSHFRRVKQLGTGDVGLVDLVELQQGGSRCGAPWRSHTSFASPTCCTLIRARLDPLADQTGIQT